jgi:hypothetical protein
VITGVIVHIENELPIMADIEELPAPTDMLVRCMNVRTVDGKRPAFAHDLKSTFIFPIGVIRLIEVPEHSQSRMMAVSGQPDDVDDEQLSPQGQLLDDGADEEPDEDLLARIRQI